MELRGPRSAWLDSGQDSAGSRGWGHAVLGPCPQLLAGCVPTVALSGFSLQAVSSEERFWNASGAAFVTVQEPGQLTGAVLTEILLTMLLTLAVCMGAINEKTQGPLAPFSIGFSVTVGILAGCVPRQRDCGVALGRGSAPKAGPGGRDGRGPALGRRQGVAGTSASQEAPLGTPGPWGWLHQRGHAAGRQEPGFLCDAQHLPQRWFLQAAGSGGRPGVSLRPRERSAPAGSPVLSLPGLGKGFRRPCWVRGHFSHFSYVAAEARGGLTCRG